MYTMIHCGCNIIIVHNELLLPHWGCLGHCSTKLIGATRAVILYDPSLTSLFPQISYYISTKTTIRISWQLPLCNANPQLLSSIVQINLQPRREDTTTQTSTLKIWQIMANHVGSPPRRHFNAMSSRVSVQSTRYLFARFGPLSSYLGLDAMWDNASSSVAIP